MTPPGTPAQAPERPPENPSATAAPPKGRPAQRTRQVRELGVLLAVAVLITATWLHNPGFLSAQGVRDLFLGATVLSVLAVGQAMVLITRNVDLSVGSVMGLSAFGTGILFVTFPGLPVPVAMLCGVAIGAVCGLLNGALVTTVQVPALVVTLGTLYAFRGINHWWADGGQVNAHDMPAAFLALGRVSLLGVPLPAAVAIATVVVVGLYLAHYRSGRELYAIGSNADAARLSGIPAGRRVLTAFAVNGALAGLAGVLFAARYGTVDSTVGTGMELQVVAAAVVGGVAIAGGVGTVYGAAVGAVLMTTITAALPIWQINQFWHQAVVGALILAAIGLDRLLALRTARKLGGGGARGA
ncbi:sugar ABC transporter permease [Nocardiopsis terrae]|uniref:Autoinducer 2 import system permease protein LsrC n=1 Tax=Nocardiopsis terrae TaxID=372655 RepID=A0ABR9HIL3_9ACTN|nr:rhamnose transport system permease protein [Nocardiopsis terrae]GHC79067.1 sugar ABC transporter permease [Nocardiopsis terrae]